MATDQVYATPFPSSGGVPEGRGGLGGIAIAMTGWSHYVSKPGIILFSLTKNNIYFL